MIDLSHVYKIYSGSSPALSDVSLKIAKGEFVYLTGPSGAGKTTLFRLITCYDQPTSGKILVSGQDLAHLTSKQIPYVRRKIGIVFQDFRLLKNRTAFENIALPLEVLGMRRSEISSRVANLLDRVSLRYKGGYYPAQLSGGEQQRIAIARSLISQPDLLIADEPTGNLDQTLSEEIMSLFNQINAQGTTVVVATHNQSFFAKGGRRLIRLEKGRLNEDEDRKNAQNESHRNEVLLDSPPREVEL
jgi:cell division transport system ATP-binding protein